MPPRFTLFIPRYRDEDFEWDERKSAATFDDRDFVFEAARIVFRYASRGSKCRIISLRPATDVEALIYHDR